MLLQFPVEGVYNNRVKESTSTQCYLVSWPASLLLMFTQLLHGTEFVVDAVEVFVLDLGVVMFPNVYFFLNTKLCGRYVHHIVVAHNKTM